jgi:hypothetical protein
MENHNLNMIMKRESLNKSIIINKRITTYDVGISGPGMEQARGSDFDDVFYRLFISVLLLEIQLSRGEGVGISPTGLTLPHLCACSMPGPEIPTSYVVILLLIMMDLFKLSLFIIIFKL